MKFDDHDVERVAGAMFREVGVIWQDWFPDSWTDDEFEGRHGTDVSWDEFNRYGMCIQGDTDSLNATDFRRMARAALDAMEREPSIEDVLKDNWAVTMLEVDDFGVHAEVNRYEPDGDYHIGGSATSQTIDEAIRNAVAAAKTST